MNNTIEELIAAYKNGQRHFKNWNFEEDASLKGYSLPDIHFEECFMFIDLRNVDLTQSQFVKCNLKTSDFREANLKGALIKNCSVESIMFRGANLEDFQFENNYYFRLTLKQTDFPELLKQEEKRNLENE